MPCFPLIWAHFCWVWAHGGAYGPKNLCLAKSHVEDAHRGRGPGLPLLRWSPSRRVLNGDREDADRCPKGARSAMLLGRP